MADAAQVINSVLIPLNGQNLVLPQSAMAEVIPHENLEAMDTGVGWLKGFIDWRGHQIPVISLEGMCDRSGGLPTKQSRFVVVYGLEGIPGLSFYAVEVRGIPHPVKLGASALVVGGVKDKDCLVVACNVVADGEPAIIPDLVSIEHMIRAQLERM